MKKSRTRNLRTTRSTHLGFDSVEFHSFSFSFSELFVFRFVFRFVCENLLK
jgi:hypothetical protein